MAAVIGQGARSIPARSIELRGRVDNGLRLALGDCPGTMRPLCGEALGIAGADGLPVTGGGKRLRPLLCLQVCDALGGDLDLALLPALALECIHAFSLVHDDIADGDRERRGRPSLWARAGTGPALNAGDALMALGLGLAWRASPWAAALIHSATLSMIEGQHLDMSAEGAIAASVGEWERLATRKTGALFAAASAAGAATALDGDDAAVESFWRLGERLGLAFQARDDILGMWGDPALTGKPVGGDLERRKASLAIAVALDAGALDLAAALEDPATSPAQLLALLEATDARDRALAVEHGHRRAVEALVEMLVPAVEGGAALRGLLAAMWGRTS
ncbi:MAG TPA: polyprenyl synthetase family protein [Candidatus Dormibacteraeota bacterium]|nr:polyprenyl synthetase family protein [Candidatus Dormibacteraeota bacterium]